MSLSKDREEVLNLGLAALKCAEAENRPINPPVGAGHAESLAGMLRLAHVVNPQVLLEVFRASNHVAEESVEVIAYSSSSEAQRVDAILYKHVPGE